MLKISVLCLLCIVLISGCTSDLGSSDATASDTPTTITNPSDFTNSSRPGSHVHNYWEGQTSRPVFESQVSLLYAGPTVCPNNINDHDPNCVELQPLAEHMVPPGSRALNVTATWGQLTPATPGYLNVYYEAPLADGGFSSGTVQVENGATASINVTEENVDLPHTVQTRWRLWVSLAATAPGPYTVNFEGQAIRKVGELEPAPPHPDHWANKTRLLLNEYEGPYGELLGQDGVPGLGEHPGANFSPEEGKIVPPLTAEVLVTVHLNVSTPSETAPEPLLNWRGADRRDNEVTGMEPSESKVQDAWHTWQWTIQPEPHMWDSPYAVESNWGIFIDWSGGLGPVSPTATQGDVSIRVDARQ